MISSLFAIEQPRTYPPATHDWWYSIMGATSDTGEVVTPDTALGVSAGYACVRVLVDAISTLPCITYRRRADGGKERANDADVYTLLHDTPNDWQTSVEFWESIAYGLVLRGNGLAEMRRGDNGEPVGRLNPINPAKVQQAKLEGGKVRYKIQDGADLTSDRVFHVRGMAADSVWGMSPVTAARNAIPLAKAAESFGSKLFRDGIKPSGVVEHPGEMSDKAYQRLKASIDAEHSGQPHRAMILEESATWKTMSFSPEDSQFLETRRFQIEEIARVFRVPLHMIGELTKASYNNSEQQAIDFVTNTLRPWLIRIEKAIQRDIMPDGLFAEFLVDSLLRGDTAARFAAYSSAIASRIMNPNEARQRENMNPYDGGDVFANPAIDTSPNSGSGGDADESMQNAHRIRDAYAQDIAGRVASRELKELVKRAKHQASDPGRFSEFLREFYDGHAQYVDASLSGLCDALEVRESDRISLVQSICSKSIDELQAGDAVTVVQRWETGELASRINTTIKGAIS